MRNIKILEMINEGRIEELKNSLREEIYAETLNANKPPGAKRRYVAMKKYFTYTKSERDILRYPCIVDFEGRPHTSFCNSFSLALTTEPCGTIQLYTGPSKYPDVTKLVSYDGEERVLDFNKIFALAKSQGYKLKKSELSATGYKYLMLYEGAYYKLGLVDATFSIIDDNEEAVVYHTPGKRAPITIKTNIGVCTIMPLYIEDEDLVAEDIIIIDVDI